MGKHDALVAEVQRYLTDHGLTQDVCIYADGIRHRTSPANAESAETDGFGWAVDRDIDPKTYIEYANPDTLTMSFEGPLYHEMNRYTMNTNAPEDLEEIFRRHGYYSEMGYAWSLSLYPD